MKDVDRILHDLKWLKRDELLQVLDKVLTMLEVELVNPRI